MSPAERHEFIVTANVSDGSWDLDKLLAQYGTTELTDYGLDDLLKSLEQNAGNQQDDKWSKREATGALAERFGIPPFSVLCAFRDAWMKRKQLWRALIQDFGESREGTLAGNNMVGRYNNGVSLLDPVLAEICCRWFSPEGGTAFDCFAGDTVFGYVAAKLGHKFTGIELREEQARLNNERVAGMDASYICDDGQNVASHF